MTEEQKKAVASWADEGAGISEIQNRLASEFDVHMSYMETRLMLMDINVSVKDKVTAPKKNDSDGISTGEAEVSEDEDGEEYAGDEDSADADSADALSGGADGEETADEGESGEKENSGGDVSVEVNRIAQPGFVVTGSAVFPDGVSAEWGITNDGRISFVPSKPGYRPSAEDMRKFQLKLRDALYGKGY